MQREVNRASQLWRNWQQQEAEMKSVLGENIGNVELKRQEYDFLTQGLYRITPPISAHEEFSLNIIRTIRKSLQRQLYPNPFLRFYRQMKEYLVDRPLFQQKYKANLSASVDLAEAKLETLGFKNLRSQLKREIFNGSSSISLKVVPTMQGEHCYSAELKLVEITAGEFKLEGYAVSQVDPDGVHRRSVELDAAYGIVVGEAFNLLAGRSICILNDDSYLNYGSWYRLDLESSGGICPLNEISPAPGFTLQSAVKEAGELIGCTNLADLQVLEGMKRGDQVRVTVKGDMYLIEASPGSEGTVIRKPSGELVSKIHLAAQLRREKASRKDTTQSIIKNISVNEPTASLKVR